jgi:LPXTG-motif cell wall-anchored protein
VPVRRLIAAALAIAALGIAPGAALAQSGGAGDDQYVDPFGSSTTQKQSSGSGSSSAPGTSGSSTGPALSSAPSLSASATAQAAPAAASGQTLPRTGMDAGLVAALGLTLLLAGAALRVRLRHERH